MGQDNPTTSLEYFEAFFQNPSPSWDSYAQSWHPCIPNDKKRKVRNLFGIGMNETILSVHNSAAFWNSLSSGCVMTDTTIYYLSEDKSTCFNIPLAEIGSVQFQDNAFYFFNLNGDHYATLGLYDLISPDSSVMTNENQIGVYFAQLLSGMASFLAPVDPTAVHDAEIERLTNDGQIDDAVRYVQQLIAQDDGTYKSWWYASLSGLYNYQMKDYLKASEACVEGLKYCEDGTQLFLLLHHRKNEAETEQLIASGYLDVVEKAKEGYGDFPSLRPINVARGESLLIYQLATTQTISDGTPLKDYSSKEFSYYNGEYCQNFLRQPYNDRKVLLIVKEYTDLQQDNLCVMKKSDIPCEMSFPIGHPQEGQIYVGHPFIPAKYVPFEEYQLEFIEDKVREFTWLMQCMGATKISISAKNDNEQTGDYSSSQSVSGNTSYGIAKASGSFSGNSKGSFAEQISKAISLNQEFNPTKAPFIPDGLVWYQNEPSWQRLVNQRMTGSLVHASESIESRKSNMVNGSELTNIKAEFHSLVSLDGEWTKEEEAKFQQQENATLTFEIDFAPVESLSINTDTPSNNKVVDDEMLQKLNTLYSRAREIYNEWSAEMDNITDVNVHLNKYISIMESETLVPSSVGVWESQMYRLSMGYPKVDNNEMFNKAMDAIDKSIAFDESTSVNATEQKLLKGLIAFEPVYHSEIPFTEKSKSLFFEGLALLEKTEDRDFFFLTRDFYEDCYNECKVYFDNPEEFYRLYQDEEAFSTEEQEYIDELKFMLEDGEIGERERKSLERRRERLGITPLRASELEYSLSSPQITPNEKEYLEEVRLTLEDGEIGPRERKFLDRCASRLGISPDKAKEIESYAANF